MNQEEQRMYDNLIANNEEHYQRVREEDNLENDNALARTAFYQACLRVFRDGPRLKSPAVQAELVKYYSEKRREAYDKLLKERLG